MNGDGGWGKQTTVDMRMSASQRTAWDITEVGNKDRDMCVCEGKMIPKRRKEKTNNGGYENEPSQRTAAWEHHHHR